MVALSQQKEKGGQSHVVAGGELLSFSLLEIQELLLIADDDLGLVVGADSYKGSGTANPAELCRRFCSMLDMSQRGTQLSEALANKTSNTGALAGRSPLSAAAACIYMAGHLLNEPKAAKDIHAVAGVSDSTIRHAYKLMYNEKDRIIDDDMTRRGADASRLPVPS